MLVQKEIQPSVLCQGITTVPRHHIVATLLVSESPGSISYNHSKIVKQYSIPTRKFIKLKSLMNVEVVFLMAKNLDINFLLIL